MSKTCVKLNFLANDIVVHKMFIIGDEIDDKHKSKWDLYKSTLNRGRLEHCGGPSLEIQASKSLIYTHDGRIVDEKGDVTCDWFKFMVKYIPVISDKNAIYTLSVDDMSYGTSKDWYNLFIHSSKKIEAKINNFSSNKIDLTLSVTGSVNNDYKTQHQTQHTISKPERRSIFSDRIPERRASDTHFGRNYKGKSMEKHYKKRLTEPKYTSHHYDSDSESESYSDSSDYTTDKEYLPKNLPLYYNKWKHYDKKDFRKWLVKNHPEKNCDVQIFQMYRRPTTIIF